MISPTELTNLLQMQAEACGLLRDPPKSAADMMRIKDSMHAHCGFISNVGRVATRLQLPLEIVFQCLMHMSLASAPSAGNNAGGPNDFDRQHRQGNVPMHQAKVLKRDAAVEVEPKIAAAVPADQLLEMIQFSSSLRTLLRMKVEDGNDLSMARRAIQLADDYMQRIAKFSDNNVDFMWRIFNAKDEVELSRYLGGGGGGGGDAGNGAAAFAGGGFGESGSVGSVSVTLLPMPKDLARGLDALCNKSLVSAATPVAERQTALLSVDNWFREADERGRWSANNGDLLRAVCAVPSFRRAMALHLAEKRSALCRAACEILSALMLSLSHAGGASVAAAAEVRDALLGWLDVLLKQVHMTVATIANASDCAVRDIFVATGGATALMNMCAQVAGAASQPELQRKSMGYLALGVVAHLHFGQQGVDPAAKCSIVAGVAAKLLKSSNDGVRRAARVGGVLCRQLAPSIAIAGWDERADKAAAADVPAIMDSASSGTAAFETAALRYGEPCSVSSNRPGATAAAGSVAVPLSSVSTSAAPATIAKKHVAMSSDDLRMSSVGSSSNSNVVTPSNAATNSLMASQGSASSNLSSSTSNSQRSVFSKAAAPQQQQQQPPRAPLVQSATKNISRALPSSLSQVQSSGYGQQAKPISVASLSSVSSFAGGVRAREPASPGVLSGSHGRVVPDNSASASLQGGSKVLTNSLRNKIASRESSSQSAQQ